jgi:phenylalanyl-tRNA synthetase beta chain
VAAGLQETITHVLTTPEREKPLGLPQADYVTLANPISSERTVLRHSLLTEMLVVLRENLRHEEDVRLFEIGAVYLPRAGEKLPDEPRRLALVLCGRREAESWADPGAARPALDFFDLKGVVEGLADDLHLAAVSYQRSQVPTLHPGKAAELLAGGKAVGWFGELHPRVAAAFEMEGRAVLVGEFDLAALRGAVRPSRELYRPVPRMPAARRDVAVIVAADVPAARVADEIRKAGVALLSDVHLFDLYRGESIPQGTKSLAYALTYQAEDRTLTDKEIDKAHKKIEDRLRHVLHAQIRGKE